MTTSQILQATQPPLPVVDFPNTPPNPNQSPFQRLMASMGGVGESNTEYPGAPKGDLPNDPISFVAGTLWNVVMDIPDVVKGLTNLVGYAAEDIGRGALDIIPGEQGGFDPDQSHVGYNFSPSNLNLMKTAVAADYSSRFGGHGGDEVLQQVYHNPLSYVLDALMVGQVISKGAQIGAKAGLIAPKTMGSITGHAGEELDLAMKALEGGRKLFKPTRQFSDVWSQTGEVSMGVSTNPVSRPVQEFVLNKILTRSVDATKKLWDMGEAPEKPFAITIGGKELTIPGFRTGQPAVTGYAAGTIAPERLLQIENVVTEAGLSGQRIVKPAVGMSPRVPFSPARAARKMFGINAAEFYEGRNEALLKLFDILDTFHVNVKKLVKSDKTADAQLVHIMQYTDQENLLEQIAKGTLLPLPEGIPVINPVEVPFAGRVLRWQDAADPAFQPGTFVRPGETAGQLVKVPGEVTSTPTTGLGHPLAHLEPLIRHYGAEGASHVEDVAPHLGNVGPNSFTYRVLIGAWDQLQKEAERVSQLIGGEILHGVDYMKGQADWYRGYHVVYKTADGIVDVSFGTPKLAESQALASTMMKAARHNRGLRDALKAELPYMRLRLSNMLRAKAQNTKQYKVLEAEYATKLQGITRLEADGVAAERIARELFRRPMRIFSSEDGTYNPFLEAADELLLWQVKYGMEPFVRDYVRTNPSWHLDGLHGPNVTAMNRAFAGLKVEYFEEKMTAFWDELLPNIRAPGGYKDGGMWVQNLRNLLEMHGFTKKVPRSGGAVEDIVIDKVIGTIGDKMQKIPGGWKTMKKIPSMKPKEAEEIVQQIAKIIRDSVRENSWLLAKDGDLPGFDWETFANAVPQLPVYYPHLRTSRMKNSAFFSKNFERIEDFKPTTPAFSKEWLGVNWLQHAASMDPWEVYSRMATTYLRHEETIDAMMKLVQFGRRVTYDQMINWDERFFGSEVLFAPKWSVRKVREHQMFFEDIVDGIMKDHKSWWEASEDAINKLQERLRSGGDLSDLKTIEVYAIPKHVADAATKTVFRGISPAGLRVFVDGPMNLWRMTVLGLSPRWVLYNMMGNAIFTAIENPAALRRIWGSLHKKDQEVIDTILKSMTMRTSAGPYSGARPASIAGITKRGFVTQEAERMMGATKHGQHWGAAADQYPALTGFADSIMDASFVQKAATIPRSIRSFNVNKEQLARQGVLLDEYAINRINGLGRLFKSNIDIARDMAMNGWDAPSVNRMLNGANRVLGDYTTLGPIERDVLRRMILPFYPFYRHVLKFTARMPFAHPFKSTAFRLINIFDEEFGPQLPGYLDSAFRLGDFQGKDLYYNPQSFNPLQWFAEGTSAMGLLSPPLKMGMQAMTGVGDFGQPFTAENVYETGSGMKMELDEYGNWVPMEGIVHPPWWKMGLSQFGFPFNMLNLQGYKNPTWETRLLSQAGIPLQRFDTSKYQENITAAEIEALLYGGQP